MGEMQMISRSVYIDGKKKSIAFFAQYIKVPSENVFSYEKMGASYSFFEKRQNSMFYSEVLGDFNYFCDINLFDVEPNDLDILLLKLSGLGYTVGMPDEGSENPFDYYIYRSGTKKKAQIVEDEITQEVRIYDDSVKT